MTIYELKEMLKHGLMSESEVQKALDFVNKGSDTTYYVIVNNEIVRG